MAFCFDTLTANKFRDIDSYLTKFPSKCKVKLEFLFGFSVLALFALLFFVSPVIKSALSISNQLQ